MRVYNVVTSPMGNTAIQYEENGISYSIPMDPANSDYQEYLKWMEANNE